MDGDYTNVDGGSKISPKAGTGMKTPSSTSHRSVGKSAAEEKVKDEPDLSYIKTTGLRKQTPKRDTPKMSIVSSRASTPRVVNRSRTPRAAVKRRISAAIHRETADVVNSDIAVDGAGNIQIVNNGEFNELNELLDGDASQYDNIYNSLQPIIRNAFDIDLLRKMSASSMGDQYKKALKILFRNGKISSGKLAFACDKYFNSQECFNSLKSRIPSQAGSRLFKQLAICSFIDKNGLDAFSFHQLAGNKGVKIDMLPYISDSGYFDLNIMPEEDLNKIYSVAETYELSGYDSVALTKMARLYSC